MHEPEAWHRINPLKVNITYFHSGSGLPKTMKTTAVPEVYYRLNWKWQNSDLIIIDNIPKSSYNKILNVK